MNVDNIVVNVYEADRITSYEDMLLQRPVKYHLPIDESDHAEIKQRNNPEVILADDIDNHKKYAFFVPEECRPVTLNIYTNSNYHDPSDWEGPIEGGLTYRKGEEYGPFKTEMWGRVMMWAEPAE